MSSAYDPVIDPSLRDLPPPTRGMKRKAAAGAAGASAASAAKAASPSTGRVTRRAAKEQLAPPEPTRGEEENLIGYGRNRESATVSAFSDQREAGERQGGKEGRGKTARSTAAQSCPPPSLAPSLERRKASTLTATAETVQKTVTGPSARVVVRPPRRH